MNGPVEKKLYQFCHQRAYKWYIPKIKDDYKINGKYQQKLVIKMEKNRSAYR